MSVQMREDGMRIRLFTVTAMVVTSQSIKVRKFSECKALVVNRN